MGRGRARQGDGGRIGLPAAIHCALGRRDQLCSNLRLTLAYTHA